MIKYVECVPNISEGRRPDVVAAVRDAIAATAGAVILDTSSDESHNRSVITFVAPLDAAVPAALAAVRSAMDLIDMNAHSGEHPRIGGVDVIPFIPLGETTMEECIALAHDLGRRVGELGVPVFLYESAATAAERRNLAFLRRGNYEGLAEAMSGDPLRASDYGPAAPHPTFGGVAIGARPVLVAYNVYLGGTENLELARRIAREIRESSGGLPAVKAMGVAVDGQAQVSMNLVDVAKTSVHAAFDAVASRAAAAGVEVTWSELVGLIPERSVTECAASYLRLRNFTPAQVLERRVEDAIRGGPGVATFLEELASAAPVPGGGTAAAHAGAVAAALVQMVARLTLGRKKYVHVAALMEQVVAEAGILRAELLELGHEDGAAYAAVSEAYKLPRGSDAESAIRVRAIDDALIYAARVPLQTAELCARACELAATVARDGNSNAASDALVGAILAAGACEGAAANVLVNLQALASGASEETHEMRRRAVQLVSLSAAQLAAVRAQVAPALG